MKKILSLLLVALIISSTLILSANAGSVKGDANSDGAVDLKDVLIMRRHYVGYIVEMNKSVADYNNDGVVDITDILYTRKKLAGLFVEDSEITTAQTIETTSANNNTDIPSDYINDLSGGVQVNQIGYNVSSSKMAKLTEEISVSKVNSLINSVRCYVVDENTGKVVYSGLSSTRAFDTNTSRFVSTFDFSDVKALGKYKVCAPDGYSYTFEIKDNPYKQVNNALITALYYNRCGDALKSSVVGDLFAHDVCHSGDTPVYILNKLDTDPNSSTYGKYIQSEVKKASDFLGGLHDAGDYGRYTTPANQVVADLLMTYEMFGNTADCKIVPDSESDLLANAKHEMQWLLTMQDETSGGVYWRIATKEFVEYGNKPDADRFFKETGLYVSHVTLKATAGFVGAAAMSARAFKDIDPAFSQQCLAAAKKGYAYVKANMENPDAHKGFENSSEYPSVNAGSYGDNNKAWSDIWWAACELYRTTGEETYNTDVKSLYQRKSDGKIGFSFCDISAYSTGGAGSFAYIMANGADTTIRDSLLETFNTSAQTNLKTSEKDKYNIAMTSGDYQWGSNQILCVKLKVMVMLDYINNTTEYESVIRDNICYMLGRNAVNTSFVTGYGSATPLDICHAPSAHLRVKYNLYTPAPGFIVGGAYPNGATYEDHHDNYACNEVCVYWNSSAIVVFSYIVNYDS